MAVRLTATSIGANGVGSAASRNQGVHIKTHSMWWSKEGSDICAASYDQYVGPWQGRWQVKCHTRLLPAPVLPPPLLPPLLPLLLPLLPAPLPPPLPPLLSLWWRRKSTVVAIAAVAIATIATATAAAVSGVAHLHSSCTGQHQGWRCCLWNPCSQEGCPWGCPNQNAPSWALMTLWSQPEC